ncbi:hypothetical protein [Corynebacterium flavescens]|nr:hypothetical protein [Corynebacterium flavescens]
MFSAAGVRMSITSETAKAWNDAAAETDTLQVPDVPQHSPPKPTC